MQELEDTVLSFLEKGVTVEQDVLANLKTVLPPDAAQVRTLSPTTVSSTAQSKPPPSHADHTLRDNTHARNTRRCCRR